MSRLLATAGRIKYLSITWPQAVFDGKKCFVSMGTGAQLELGGIAARW